MAPPVTDIVTLADVKTFMQITSTANDAELSNMISAASTMWNRKYGPVSGSPSYDEWYDGGASTISLRNIPVLTVTSVIETFGSSYTRTLVQEAPDSGVGTAFDYSIDLTSGLLTRRAMGIGMSFAPGDKNIHVVYTAGYSSVPYDIQQAVWVLVAHLWETQRGRMVIPGQPPADWNPAMAYTWPRRVREVGEGYYVPGIA